MKAGLLACALGVLLLGTTRVDAQGNRPCTGEPPDSTMLLGGPVYRDCEVERPARMRSTDFPIDFTPTGVAPAGGCYRVAFQFVVDSMGRPETTTVTPLPGNDRVLEDAVLPGLPQLRYQAALLGGARVRQIVVYRRAVQAIMRVNPTEGEPIGLPATRTSGNCR